MSRAKARTAPPGPAAALSNGETLSQVIDELLAKQRRLSELVDRALAGAGLNDAAGAGVSLVDVTRLLALYAQNASRLGRLLRDRHALADTAADGLAAAIDQALDALAAEWGAKL